MHSEGKISRYYSSNVTGIIFKSTRWLEATKRVTMSKFKFKTGETCSSNVEMFSR